MYAQEVKQKDNNIKSANNLIVQKKNKHREHFGFNKTQPNLNMAMKQQNYSNPIQRIMWYMSVDHSSAITLLSEKNGYGFAWLKKHGKGAFRSSDLRQDETTTITLWGHTNAEGTEFGQLSASQLVDGLIVSGLDDSKHTEISIMSCAPNLSDNKGVATYSQDVQSLLAEKVKRKVQVKTLPMSIDQDSILYRWEADNKIAYVRCPKGQMATLRNAETSNPGYKATVSAWKKLGYTVDEMKFSNVLSKLVNVVVPKFGGEGNEEFLIPDYRGK